ncbi:MAG: RagB/SusD family nutrient uptake outer membrane protein [Clostridium sp.]|nr:RagB/SusD family nutrient uptake outer membrane protein [Clostridium sp.]
MKKIIPILGLACMLASCDDLFEPAIENNLGLDAVLTNPDYAGNLLGNAYTRLPNGSYSFSDVATDDAVSNDATNSYRKLAAGTWTSDNNPFDRWQNCRAAIQYINLFMQYAPDVEWNSDETLNKMFLDRHMGEAYALRAMFTYYLLQSHGGYTADGELLGIPILTEPESQGSDFNVPRNTFAECVKAIESDIALAMDLLPSEYGDASELARMQAKYGTNQVNRAFGENFLGRMSGRIAQAVLTQTYILAASPAYSGASGVTYEMAANQAAKTLAYAGGIDGVDPNGYTWYCNATEIENLANGYSPKEVLWRGEKSESTSLESDHFPPTLYGNGRLNPSQNLVDAFPMANGYPISDPNSGYDAKNPYAGRDPRLAAYVTYNGMTCALEGTTVNTAVDGPDNNALNKIATSTRTGYYLRKLLRQDVSLNPNGTNSRYHYTPRIRYTEIYLDYAEAANESWGPTGQGSNGYSAYDVIKAIRSRAGVGAGNDAYLEACKADKEKMRELIRNERRLELCFEGHRFWDLRRWKAELNETVKGMSISDGEYTVIDVETRNFRDFQYYGPIPYSEILKFSNLKQNKGW